MFLVCDKITHLHTLLFSWSYDQENDTLPIDLPGRTTRKITPSLDIRRGCQFPGTSFQLNIPQETDTGRVICMFHVNLWHLFCYPYD